MHAKEPEKKTLCKERPVIYQVFPRILTNSVENPTAWGDLARNGSGHLNDFTPRLLNSIKSLGVNTIWLTGVIEHATKSDFTSFGIEKDNPNVVKGEAGSPYAISDYYDVAPELAENVEERMKEFEACAKRIHEAGMKVIIDFVPNHTARRYHSDAAPAGVKDFGASDDTSMFFLPSNNYYYITNQQFFPDFDIFSQGDRPYIEFPAKATGNDCFTAFCSQYDWYETVKLNYGHDYGDHSDHFQPVPDTWLKMLDILRFWLSKGVDGFRCDMVFMVPLPFWHWVIAEVKQRYPEAIFIGEIYDVGQYRPFLDYGGFDYLYDKVNLYDKLVGIERHGFSAAQLTYAWQTVDGIGPRMLNFLENHDEVRFGGPEFGGDPSRVVPDLVVSSMISSGPFMIYYGQELGESARDNEGFAGDNNRTTIFDYWSYDTMRRWYDHGKCGEEKLTKHEIWLRNVYARTLGLLNEEPALRCGAFFDLMYVNLDNPDFSPHRNFAFLRHTPGEALLIVVNFADEPMRIRINIPKEAIEAAGLAVGQYAAEELLWKKMTPVIISSSEGCPIELKARDAVVIRLRTADRPDTEASETTSATTSDNSGALHPEEHTNTEENSANMKCAENSRKKMTNKLGGGENS